jgi:hypothetical protein
MLTLSLSVYHRAQLFDDIPKSDGIRAMLCISNNLQQEQLISKDFASLIHPQA